MVEIDFFSLLFSLYAYRMRRLSVAAFLGMAWNRSYFALLQKVRF